MRLDRPAADSLSTSRILRMGNLAHGETTLVIDWLQADQVAPAAKPDRWGKALRLLRQTLMNVLVNHGAEQQPWPDGPTVRAADIEIVRAEFYKSYPAHGDEKAKQQVRKKGFQRAIKDAQAKGLIGVRDIGAATYVWLATRGGDCDQ